VVGGVLLLVAFVARLSTMVRMDRLERKIDAIMRHLQVDLTQGRPMSEMVKQLARDPSGKIEAIRLYRQETGVGLAEAKDAVEAYIAQQ
jgi:ribosomal protein L7/L12